MFNVRSLIVRLFYRFRYADRVVLNCRVSVYVVPLPFFPLLLYLLENCRRRQRVSSIHTLFFRRVNMLPHTCVVCSYRVKWSSVVYAGILFLPASEFRAPPRDASVRKIVSSLRLSARRMRIVGVCTRARGGDGYDGIIISLA